MTRRAARVKKITGCRSLHIRPRKFDSLEMPISIGAIAAVGANGTIGAAVGFGQS